jgi:hypothetical protein
VAELGASNRHDYFRQLSQNILYAMQMAQMEWLVPSYQQPTVFVVIQIM